MNLVFKLMLFSIVLNFATGIMLVAIVDADGNSIFTLNNTGGLIYNETYAEGFTVGLNSTIDPGYGIEEQGNWFDRVLDKLGLGIIRRLLNTIDKYMFGFVQVLKGVFGGGLNSGTRTLLFGPPGYPFGVFQILITVGYIIGAIWLWTGKSLTTD